MSPITISGLGTTLDTESIESYFTETLHVRSR